MKRLIKYTSPYEEIQFSNCSTKYEVLPFVVEDNAGSKELRELTILLGFTPIGNCKTLEVKQNISITHTVAVETKPRLDWHGKIDSRRPIETTRLGFITLNERDAERCGIEVNVELEGELTEAQSYNILNNQAFDFYDFITIDNEVLLNIETWDAFHYLELLGYSLQKFMESHNCKETVFSDSVTSCGQCGEWMFNDNGYTYNYRFVDSELLGIACGCYKEHIEQNWQDRINDTRTPIEKDIAETLEDSGKIEHLERFIGGMTDGRGGYYNGESTREGDPETVLAEYKRNFPSIDFIFTHDESGQFQTYFSIYKVIGD